MSSEKEQVTEKLEPVEAEESSVELEDSDIEEVAGGEEDAATISRLGKERWGK